MTPLGKGLILASTSTIFLSVIKPLIDLVPSVPVGRFKTFGPLGPTYEIVSGGRQGPDNEWLVQIRLVDSGERTEYSYVRLQQDPDVR